jgi:transglutaminase-like putative cysteine protease
MAQATAPGVSIRLRLLLGACLGLIGLPHVLHLPLWVAASAGVLLAWQILAAWRAWPAPNLALRVLLIAAAFIAVFIGFGRVNGESAGVALLLLMMLLKLCEIRRHRDVMVLLSLSCFLLATQFLFSQSLAMAAYLLVATWLLISVFVTANTTGGTLRAAAAEAARLLLWAAPIAAALFVLFPRIPGPAWGPSGPTRAVTGLSDHMRPGSIAALARSDAVAFRVRFPDGTPPPRARYWRGPVLWDFDHGTWRMDAGERARSAPAIQRRKARVLRSVITLAPTAHRWLIALDTPLAADVPSRLDGSATLMSTHAIDTRIRYTVRSALGGRIQPTLDAATRARATRLPAQGNPRARALAARWVASGAAPRSIVAKAQAMFRHQDFHYTLTPPPTSTVNGIDDFLFSTRSGFCEHYAGAFTFLMRAAGIPARVVTGYQGGEHSAAGNYWIVREADAHAWSEVWLADRGWVRVDPTAAVAPARIDAGIGTALAGNPALPFMARANGDAWYQARLLWDAVNAGWDRWFLAYGPALQQHFLATLSLSGAGRALGALILIVVGLLVLIAAGMAWRMRRAPHPDQAVRYWQRVARRLSAIGLARVPGEGPLAYAERVARARPDLAVEIRALAVGYARLRYASGTPEHDRQQFINQARAFSPRRRAARKGKPSHCG